MESLIYTGLTIVAGSVIGLYSVLVLLTPPPIVTRSSEKIYRSSGPRKQGNLPSVHDRAEVDLSVVVPAYNEAKRLPAMLDAAFTHLRLLPKRTFEVLIIDDGSKDETVDVALSLGAKEYAGSDIRVVKLEKNGGKGAAVRHGMLHARGERLLMVDADGASKFEDLEKLWKAIDDMAPHDGPAVAVGSRAHLVGTEAVVKRSILRNILMYGLHTILRVVGVGHISDTQCGFKLFTRGAAKQIFPSQHLATWMFDVELLLIAKRLGIPVAEVPVGWQEVPGSKLNVALDSIRMLVDLLVLRGNMLTGRWKVEYH